MVGTVVIRPMNEADVDDALAIEEATYPVPWTARIFRDELVAPGRTYLVATESDRVVGYAGLMAVLPEAHVTSVTVDPVFRGRSIGTRLMLSLIDEALTAGATSLTLEVRVSNKAAQALYHHFGMAPVGVRKRYYRDEDALVMWVHDIDRAEYRERLAEIGDGLPGASSLEPGP